MGQSAQEAHMFFVHKIHRKIYPVEGSGENASSPTVDIVENWENFLPPSFMRGDAPEGQGGVCVTNRCVFLIYSPRPRALGHPPHK